MPSDERFNAELAVICEGITADPTAALRKAEGSSSSLFQQLHERAAGAGGLALPRRRRALLSQCAVFLDVLPAYRVRVATAAEKSQPQTKEVKELRDREERLLRAYTAHLRLLRASCAGDGDALTPAAVKCLGALFAGRPHFNFRDDLLTLLAPKADHADAAVRQNALDALRRALRDDASGEVTLVVARAIAKLVRDKSCRLRSDGPVALLADDAKLAKAMDDEAFLEKKHLAAKAVRKQPAKAKKRKGVTFEERQAAARDLKLSEAVVDGAEWRRTQRLIIHEVGLVVGRVVAAAADESDDKARSQIATKARALLPAALRGLQRISRSANVDVISGCLERVRRLAGLETLDAACALECARAALATTAGDGAVLDLDDDRFHDGVFRALLRVAADGGGDDRAALECLARDATDAAPAARAAALLRRSLLFALHRDDNAAALAFLGTARKALATAKTADSLLDDDEARGPYATLPPYDARAPTLERCGALGTPAFELLPLARHYDPRVRALAKRCLSGAALAPREFDPKALLDQPRFQWDGDQPHKDEGPPQKKKRKQRGGDDKVFEPPKAAGGPAKKKQRRKKGPKNAARPPPPKK